MANDMVPAGGEDGSLIVSVDGSKAIAGLSALEARIYGFVNSSQNMFNRFGGMFSGVFGPLGGIISGLTGSFGGLLGQLKAFIGLREVFNLFEGFVSRVIEVNRAFTGFIASMGIIKGSMQGARQEYAFLLDLTKRLGVDLEQSITQYHRLAASLKNVDSTGELARNIFAGISEAATVLHSRGRDVTLIFEAVQQMASKGKLSLEELQRQLGNTLPGAMSIAARAMMGSSSFINAGVKNVAEAEQFLRKSIQNGTINVYEFLLRFSQQLKKEYGAGVEFAAQQFTASFNRMKAVAFDFFRVVGDSGMMSGLTQIVNAVTKLFDANGALGGAKIGGTLGDMFGDIAEWIGKLKASDIQEVFASIQGMLMATILVAKDFIGIFAEFDGAGIKTPLLNFAEFIAQTMASVVDVLRSSVALIKGIIDSFKAVWYDLKEFVLTIPDALATAASLMPGSENNGQLQKYMAWKSQRESTRQANLDEASSLYNTALMPDDNNTYAKVGRQFDALRTGLAGQQAGIPQQNYNTLGSTDFAKQFNGQPGMMVKTDMPDWMTPNKGAGGYTNPMGDFDFNNLLNNVLAHSGAPNQGKTKRSPSDKEFDRENTSLLKDLATAQIEYTNVLENRNLSEGKHVAQMRVLMSTDDRYIQMSQQQRDTLMDHAKALDEWTLKVENATKVQSYHNDTLRQGYDIQSQLASIAATSYETKYTETIKTQNSFKVGGENEYLDALQKEKMLKDAIQRDDDARSLDMANFEASIHLQNDELKFQASLFGRSQLEQQKLTEFHKIDLWVAQQSAGASQEMIDKYKRLAEILKTDVAGALDYVHDKQTDALAGISDVVQKYMDSAADGAQQWGSIMSNTLANGEAALVSFFETGKLSMKDFTKSLVKDLTQLIAKYIILAILQAVTGMRPGNSSQNTGFMNSGSYFMGDNAGDSFYAKGGVFGGFFAKGSAFTNGIYSQPTMFAFAGGSKFGVMGEAGAEAVMPLAKDRSGALGVKMVDGAGGGNSELNLTVQVFKGEGDGVRTEKHREGNQDILKVFIGEVAADIMRGGPVAKAVQSKYGLRQTAKSYS